MEATADTTTARQSRSTAARKAVRNAAPGSASQLSALLERIWRKVQAFAANAGTELPTVHLVTGMGTIPQGIRLGHLTVGDVWSVKGTDATKVHELFIAGETLGRGAVLTLETILHEATHLLGIVREVKDTSRDGRYHNEEFVKLAATFELEYTHGKPSRAIGFSAVTLSDLGRIMWADELNQLDAEVKACIPTVELVRRNPNDPADDRMVPAPTVAAPARVVRRRNTYACGCRSMTMFAEEFEAGPVECSKCGQEFHG